jgi:RNA polymerase sigma-70 factor, ECF subfamily
MDIPVEAIWNNFHGQLEGFIRRRVPDAHAADDLLQEVFIKIHHHIDDVHDEDRLQSWIYQIARNTVYDYYRATKSVEEVTEMIAAPDDEDDPAEEVTERLIRSVRGMMELLPAEYREAVLLTEVEGLTQAELAERLGISVSGAKSRVQRGRKMLREMLLQCCHFEFDRLGAVIDYQPRCTCCAKPECK